MDTHALLRAIYVNGSALVLTRDGASITVAGRPLPPDLLAEARARKPELLPLLRQHAIGVFTPGTGALRCFVPAPDCLAPRSCPVLGPCSESLMQRPCLRQPLTLPYPATEPTEENAA